jgi:hypothetical protein
LWHICKETQENILTVKKRVKKKEKAERRKKGMK